MPLCINTNMYNDHFPEKRYKRTMDFLRSVAPPPAKILDLGVKNPFSGRMEAQGYEVKNTSGEDLDLDIRAVAADTSGLVTAFEIFEHLVSPFTVLQAIKASKLVATVPLRLWFAGAYRSKTDMWDRHFHEFEDWQFDWLLEKAGWAIKKTEKWTHPVGKFGLRPVLRYVTPRYYAVYAERR